MNVDRLSLLGKMEIAAKACPSKTSKDILRFAKLAFDGQGLSITTTDCEVGARLLIPGGIEGKPVTMVVPAAQAVNVLKELNSDRVDLEWDGGAHAVIRGESDTIKVNAWGNVDEFPEWTHEGVDYVVNPGEFNDAVQRCVYAADRDNGSWTIKSIHLLIGGGFMEIQATNKAKAAFERIHCLGEERKVLIPPKAISTLENALGNDFSLSIGENSVEFRTPCDVVYSRQVEGRFPNFQCIQDDRDPNAPPIISLNVGDLTRFVRKAMLATDAEARRIEIEMKSQTLRATSMSEGKGATDVVMHVESKATCRVSLWAEFMKEMLSVLNESETISWEMSSNFANVFKVGGWTGILMPLVGDD